MQARYLAKIIKHFFIVLLLLLLKTGLAEATVFFQSNAEAGTCNTAVANSVWDPRGSGDFPNSQMFYRCDTPVPNSGRSKYFRIDTVNQQHDAWNERSINQINMTPGKTYYFGIFFRFDRINNQDIWHDSDGIPDSSDKLFEFNNSSIRMLIVVGFPGWAQCRNNACDHHFTFGPGMTGDTCSGCTEQALWGWPNVAPYGTYPGSGVSQFDISNFFLADYERWYAVVLGVTPSSGSTPNGRIQFWINGILTTDIQNIKTQDSSSPNVSRFYHSGTIAQPSYDAPAHQRKFDYFILSDSLADIQSAGLMSDPEAGNTRPNPPSNLRVQ
jgi:hypothetical protein